MKGSIDYSEMTFDRTLPSPLYWQLAEQLMALLGKQRHQGSYDLPSVRELSRLTHLDRTTVARAYHELECKEVIQHRSSNILCTAPNWKKRQFPFPNIGVVIPCHFSDFIENPKLYRRLYIDGIIDRAAELNYSTIMISLPQPGAASSEIDVLLNEYSSRLVGIIHLGGRDYVYDPVLHKLMNDKRIPQVMISATLQHHPNIGLLMADLLPGIKDFTHELASLGHRRIGMVRSGKTLDVHGTGTQILYESHTRVQRIQTYLEQEGFLCPKENLIYNAYNYQELFYQILQQVRHKCLPDVYCCENDQIAIGAMTVLEKLDIRVPEEVSVVGFDGISPEPYMECLTSFALPFNGLGALAVDMLLDLDGNGSNPQGLLRTLPVKFLKKKTLGPAPSRNSKES